MDITTGEFSTTLAVFFLIGGLVGWALFGERFELANRAWGTVAEWLSALGTWAIGIAAAVLAYTVQRTRRRAIRANVREKARRIGRTKNWIKTFDGEEGEEKHPTLLVVWIETSAAILDRIAWTGEEFAEVDEESLERMHNIEGTLQVLRKMRGLMLDAARSSGSTISKDTRTWMTAFESNAVDLAAQCDELCAGLRD